MKFIPTKNRMIPLNDPNYNIMGYRDKKPRIPPQRLTAAEARTVAALVISTQSKHLRRDMIVDLLLQVDSDSFNMIYELIGEKIMSELMPTC